MKSITLTIVANMTSNYGESLGNISSVQKFYKNGKAYAMRSKESLKNAIMNQCGFYDTLKTESNGVTQKSVETFSRALEAGYMNTNIGGKGITYSRKSSFYLTDAVSCDEFNYETRFNNNLNLAQKYAEQNNLNVQNNAKETGLMIYNYEFDKTMKVYSLTLDLDRIGKDANLGVEVDNSEKIERVNAILEAVRNLSLVVKMELDNAEPLFVVGGTSNKKTHVFENLVHVKDNKIVITDTLIDRASKYKVGVLDSIFDNELDIKDKLGATTVDRFFDELEQDVVDYFEGR